MLSALIVALIAVPHINDVELLNELRYLYEVRREKEYRVAIPEPVSVPTEVAPTGVVWEPCFSQPLDALVVSGWTFKDPRNPIHLGIDWFCETGQPIYAAEGGGMQRYWNEDCGNYAIIWHPNGWASAYCHLDSFVSSGRVGKGDVIGLCGNTGASTGSHLHFEILKDRARLDPSLLIP
jgi:murein DD-endopeptidase MepM/ murein hydrolase activator NlpD